MKTILKIILFSFISSFLLLDLASCKKDKLITDAGSKLQFSQDSVLFDTVFTTIGSSTQNIRIRNKNNQRIKISAIELVGGSASAFILNVDGSPGRSFTDIEIAAHDSMYIFIQVNVNPGGNMPFIINDAIKFVVNENIQTVYLEAWGQDAYYHYPTDAIKFKDGSYLPFSYLNNDTNAINVTWPNDKPHVIYGYLVVYTNQTLTINAGVQVYLNYKAGLWVYQKGELHVKGQKGNEVTFQGARREKDYADEPGQWDRIWINEGSDKNEIDYAIIKNGYIGIQAENLGTASGLNPNAVRRLKLTNTKIQNMSLWGLYGLCFNIYGGNNVISSCQEHSVNLELGGKYTFIHCTFANFWNKDKARDKPALNVNNHTDSDVWPMDSAYFGNCIIAGKLGNEVNLDLDFSDNTNQPGIIFSSCWLRTTNNTSDVNKYINVSKGDGLDFKDYGKYNLEVHATDSQIRGFTDPKALIDVQKFPFDLNNIARNTTSVTVGAYN
ncbi:MAG: hypothetical protein ABIP51_12300 [Bacteroidia bacterium]